MVDDNLRPLKSGQTRLSVPVCVNDATPPNPTTPGRGVADVHTHTNNCCGVCSCDSVRCKTCKHICQGNKFVILPLCVAIVLCVCVCVFFFEFGHWVCGESWLAIKDSLTHHPSSQGWAPGVLLSCFA